MAPDNTSSQPTAETAKPETIQKQPEKTDINPVLAGTPEQSAELLKKAQEAITEAGQKSILGAQGKLKTLADITA
jgi:hypothetical protein